MGRTDFNYKFNEDGNVVVKPLVDFRSVLDLDMDELQRKLDNTDLSRRLKFLFEEPQVIWNYKEMCVVRYDFTWHR